jgi:hypothetical protein
MSEEYIHTLIAIPKNFTPAALQVQKFLSALEAQQVVPENPAIILRIPTGKMREFPNLPPTISQQLSVEIKEHKRLQELNEISSAVGSLPNYELNLASVGRPKLPPLKINFNEPYHVGITCRVYSECRSTSNPHEENDNEKIIHYGKICSESQKDGLFTNPHNGASFKISDAGCARFWIEFELGKFLFPEFTNSNLAFLNPFIVKEAEQTFGIQFVQGCCW